MLEVYGTQVSLAEAFSNIWFNERALEDARKGAVYKLRQCFEEWTQTLLFLDKIKTQTEFKEQVKLGTAVLKSVLAYYESDDRDFFTSDQLSKNRLGSLLCLQCGHNGRLQGKEQKILIEHLKKFQNLGLVDEESIKSLIEQEESVESEER